MTEQPMMIEREWADGFRHAVGCFRVSWDPDVHGPKPSINGRGYTIGDICRHVMGFGGQMPDNLIAELLDAASYVEGDVRARVLSERSYAAGAQCLLRALEIRTLDRQKVKESPHNCGLSAD